MRHKPCNIVELTGNLEDEFVADFIQLGCHGGERKALEVLRILETRYREPQRHYHTNTHVEEVLAAAHKLLRGTLQKNRPLVRMALWFHDAVYDPNDHRPDVNEQSSVRLAVELLAGASVKNLNAITSAIRATAHLNHMRAQRLSIVERVVISADLSILAAPMRRFAEYCKQIRREYELVPMTVYHQHRIAILEKFLAQRPLFPYPKAEKLWGMRARKNLASEVSFLKYISS